MPLSPRRDPDALAERTAGLSDAMFRLLVDSVKDYAIFILDPTGRVATWNPGAQRIKGYSASEIIGRHFSVFYPPDIAATDKCERELAIATEEGRFEEEGIRLRKDGTPFWASVTITALRSPDGEIVGFAKVTRDLTERIKAEEDRRNLAAQSAALREQVRIREFQEIFLGILGHDLRNPLASLDMGTTLLRQLASNPAMVRILDRMSLSSRRMARMIEQILDLTRSRLVGRLEVKPAPMDLCSAISAIVDELRGAHPARVITVHCSTLEGVWDRDRLEQVLSNLIGNALAYGDPATPVTIDARAEGGQVTIVVHNHGPPISEALQAKLFDPFRRGERESRTSNTDGLGLGLYITNEIVRAHGGTISVRSNAADGTTFVVILPHHETHNPAAAGGKLP
jgi:PAS domain S-box-containing protein